MTKKSAKHDEITTRNWSLCGLRIITDEVVGDPYEDWSKVRSPSRARRRRAQGHQQRIVTRYRPNGTYYHDRLLDAIICHPIDYYKVQQRISGR